MTTPTGNPAWTRSSDFTTYGGHPTKANYQSQGVVNPRTDVGAEGFSRLVADTAAVARTAEFCVMQLQAGSGVVAVESCRLMTGAASTSYSGTAPPAGFPSAEFNGTGDITITFDSSYTDEYGIVGAFAAREPIATLLSSTGGVACPELVSDTVVRVRCFSLAGVAVSNARFTLTLGSG